MTMMILHPATCSNSEEDIKRMTEILSTDPSAINRPNEYVTSNPVTGYGHKVCNYFIISQDPLIDAIKLSHHKCVKFLFEAGSDIQQDLLRLAIQNCVSCKTVTCILEAGFVPVCNDTYYMYRNFYAREAVRQGLPDVLQILFDFGASVDEFFEFNMQSLCLYDETISVWTFYHNQPSCLRVCLLNGAAIDHTKYHKDGLWVLDPDVMDSLSLVHRFAVSAFKNLTCAKNILNILFELGANLWQRNRMELTPVEMRRSWEILKQESRTRGTYNSFGTPDCFSTKEFNAITDHMEELMGKPRSLMSWSRLSLMRHFRRDYMKAVKQLPLPNDIIGYLAGSDLDVSEYGEKDLEQTENKERGVWNWSVDE